LFRRDEPLGRMTGEDVDDWGADRIPRGGNPRSGQSMTPLRGAGSAALGGAPASLSTRITVPATADAPRIARRLIAVHTEAFPESMRDDAEVLISELVTNAVLHGRPAITVELTTSATAVRVAVHDTSPTLPELSVHIPSRGQETGRGLLIVDALCSDWGITASEDTPGKTVWCELSAPVPASGGGQLPRPERVRPAPLAPD
jgi:anti-sigma regulatory factor (Ser/Thr protein kinase)